MREQLLRVNLSIGKIGSATVRNCHDALTHNHEHESLEALPGLGRPASEFSGRKSSRPSVTDLLAGADSGTNQHFLVTNTSSRQVFSGLSPRRLHSRLNWIRAKNPLLCRWQQRSLELELSSLLPSTRLVWKVKEQLPATALESHSQPGM